MKITNLHAAYVGFTKRGAQTNQSSDASPKMVHNKWLGLAGGLIGNDLVAALPSRGYVRAYGSPGNHGNKKLMRMHVDSHFGLPKDITASEFDTINRNMRQTAKDMRVAFVGDKLDELEKILPEGSDIGRFRTRNPAYVPLKDWLRPHVFRQEGVNIEPEAKGFMRGSSFEPGNELGGGRLRGAPPPSIVAHELGHAQQAAIRLSIGNIGRWAGSATSLVPLFSKDEDKSRNAALVASGLHVPGLITELDASRKGSKLLKQWTGPAVWNRMNTLRRMSPYAGIPTYLLAALAPWGIYGGRKLMGGYEHPAQ